MLTAILLLAVAAAPPARTSAAAERVIRADSIRAHVRFLASDLLEGRGPGTRGDALAEAYIASQLEALGLRAAGTQGFLQPFDIVGVDGHAATVQFTHRAGSLVLRHAEDVIAVAGDDAAHTALEGAELVFVGYGIRAPEYAWDDFKGQDLRGKVLLILNSDPEDDPALFAGRTRLWYGRWDYKYEMASKVGAAGAIILHTPHSAGYPWQVVRTSWSGPQFSLPSAARRVPLRGWITEEACRRLLALRDTTLEELVRAAGRRDFHPVRLGIGVTTGFDNRVERTRTANVLALLPGSDPKLSSEVVLYTAHHDHLGMRTDAPPGEDAIYNGAEDNASGVALMLEVARAFTALPEAPRRSILFAAVAAEEQGLLGSEYLSRHPPVPLGRIAVDINIDGANVFGRTRDVTVIGLGKTDLDVTLRALARRPRASAPRRPAPGSGLLLPERPVQLRPGGRAGGVLRERARLPGAAARLGTGEARGLGGDPLPPALRRADRGLGPLRRGGGRPAAVRARVQRRPGHRAAGLDPGQRVRGTPAPVPRGAPAASARLHPGQRTLSGRVRFQRLPWPGSSSSPIISRVETSRGPSPSWSRGCSVVTRTRRCSG